MTGLKSIKQDMTVLATEEQARGMRNSIASQCCSAPSQLSFTNGIMLVYLTFLQVSSSRTILYISILSFCMMLSIFFAHWADRRGKKKIGVIGGILQAAGFGTIATAGFLSNSVGEIITVVGIVIFSLGTSIYASCWFALMEPIVPAGLRGRFWGRLRVSWQLVVIAFSLICTLILTDKTPKGVYQIILGVITLGLMVRMYFYFRVPEMEKPGMGEESFLGVFRKIIAADNYMPFCAYVFLLSLATASSPIIFGLIEKKVLMLSDGKVVLLGGLTMVGSLAGFYLGGLAIDRFGAKPAFLVCHFGYGGVLLLFVGRALIPVELIHAIGGLHFIYGVVYAASSVAITTEMMALIPGENKSVSTSWCNTMSSGGLALSGVMMAGALNLGLLNKTWVLRGTTLSNYDTILLLGGVMIILLVVTLGLVPSVIGKSRPGM